MKNKIKGLLVGILIGTLLSSTVVFAASGAMIEVFYNVKDIKINEISKMPADKEMSPFIYKGSTYVPLRFISENLGETVDWDGKTGTVYIGKRDGESAVYLGDGLKYLSYQSSHSNNFAKSVYNNNVDLSVIAQSSNKVTNNMGDEYSNFLFLGLNGNYNADSWNYVEYALNGQYDEFNATISLTEGYKNTNSTVELIIYADEEEIYAKEVSSGFLPEEISIDVSGAIKLKIELSWAKKGSTTSVILGNPKVIK